MEGAVAGTHGDCSGSLSLSVPDKAHRKTMRRTCVRGTRANAYRTTPDVNPALRRGGLISFFRKQRASRPA